MSARIEEPVQYANETISFGTLSLEDRNDSVKQDDTRGRTRSVQINQKDVKNYAGLTKSNVRPQGWADIKLRRVYLKEWEDRRAGVDEDDILEKRFQRELEAEQEMIAELGVRGKIALFEKGIRKPAKKPTQEKTRREFAAFMAQSNASLANMNSNLSRMAA